MRKIMLADHGIVPGEDCTPRLQALLDQYKEDAEFVFEPGNYRLAAFQEADYRLSNSEYLPTRRLGILMKGMKNVRLSGRGAKLLFAGHMQPLTLDHCEDVALDGLTIDWEKPMVAEGVVTGFDGNSVDLYIDPKAFPHRLTQKGWLEFDVGRGEWYPMSRGVIQFDGNTRTIRRNTGDRFSPAPPIERVGEDVYRLRDGRGGGAMDAAVGNIFALRHNERWHAAVFLEKCARITCSNITVHSCGGLGILAQFCDTLTYRRVQFVPNEAAGRRVANGRDDGLHITCCKGEVTVEECQFVGLMDDPINVHGCCVKAEAFLDRRTVRCGYGHHQARGFLYWAEDGDEISFIDRNDMAPIASARAERYELEGLDGFVLWFKEDLPEEVLSRKPESLALDNLTHTAAFTCVDNRFGSCRARGVLVSTPKPVRVMGNLFESSGSAILVSGDANGWFESGACRDVEISGNVFAGDCLSSMYQFCHGVVSVCPVIPSPDAGKPFHRNIRVVDNLFDSPDVPALYAFSCEGLEFSGNRVFRSPRGAAWHPGKALARLEKCRDVHIFNNKLIGNFALTGLDCRECEGVVGGLEVGEST